MTVAYFLAQLVNHLFKRLDTACLFSIVLRESIVRYIKNFGNRAAEIIKFFLCLFGRLYLFVAHFLCRLKYIYAVVGYSLIVANNFKQL